LAEKNELPWISPIIKNIFVQLLKKIMKQILIINGPNLNLLGKREPSVYGSQSFEDYFETLAEAVPEAELHYFQSNHEGALIDKIHEVGFTFEGIVINAGGYTHTSVALADAISAVSSPVVEVHISNIHARESFRHHSYLTSRCKGMICGLGLKGYELAVRYLLG
jgi:3-dehydroquinate dehydratase-2